MQSLNDPLLALDSIWRDSDSISIGSDSILRKAACIYTKTDSISI